MSSYSNLRELALTPTPELTPTARLALMTERAYAEIAEKVKLARADVVHIAYRPKLHHYLMERPDWLSETELLVGCTVLAAAHKPSRGLLRIKRRDRDPEVLAKITGLEVAEVMAAVAGLERIGLFLSSDPADLDVIA